MNDMRVRTDNPWGLGFTDKSNKEAVGKCADRMYLNKAKTKNFHLALSAIMSAAANDFPVEIVVNNN